MARNLLSAAATGISSKLMIRHVINPCKRSNLPAPARGPRTSRADTLFAGAFLTSAFSLKLEDLADEWFVSRATLQNDMADVREHLLRYHLTLETRPRHGMKLFGGEMAIRACLTDLLWTLAQQEPSHPLIVSTTLNTEVSQRLRSLCRIFSLIVKSA